MFDAKVAVTADCLFNIHLFFLEVIICNSMLKYSRAVPVVFVVVYVRAQTT